MYCSFDYLWFCWSWKERWKEVNFFLILNFIFFFNRGKNSKAVEGKENKAGKVKEPKGKVDKTKVEKTKVEKVKGKKAKKTKKVEKVVEEEVVEEPKVEEVVVEEQVKEVVEESHTETEVPAHTLTLQEKISAAKAAKQAKASSAYEQCKQECRVKKDQLTAQEVNKKIW